MAEPKPERSLPKFKLHIGRPNLAHMVGTAAHAAASTTREARDTIHQAAVRAVSNSRDTELSSRKTPKPRSGTKGTICVTLDAKEVRVGYDCTAQHIVRWDESISYGGAFLDKGECNLMFYPGLWGKCLRPAAEGVLNELMCALIADETYIARLELGFRSA